MPYSLSGTIGTALPGRERHVLAQGRPANRRRGSSAVTDAKKKGKPEYGSGRARLPGLSDMPGLEGALGGSPQGGASSSSSPPSSRPVGSSSSSPPSSRPAGSSSSGSSSSSNGLGAGPSRTSSSTSTPGGSSSSGGSEPTLAEYLEFGRLMGERPKQVKQQLDMSGVRVQVDEQSQQYLQSWEQEELQAYAMFEAVVAAGASSGGPPSAASKKLQRNKNILSAAASAEQLRSGARSQYERGVPMSAAQRRLARNKRNAGGVGAGMQTSLDALMEEVAEEGGEEGGFELVVAARPRLPGSASASGGAAQQLASKPSRPDEFVEYEDDEYDLDFDELWAEAEAEAAAAGAADAPPPALAYEQFDSLLGKPGTSGGDNPSKSSKKSKSIVDSTRTHAFPARGSGGGLSAVGKLKDALRERPAKPQQAEQGPQKMAADTARVQISLARKHAPPPKLAAKPQSSKVAQEAAQRPVPAPPARPAHKPTLSAKPSRPAAADVPTQLQEVPAAPKAQPPPKLAAKPAKAQAAPEPAAKPAAKAPPQLAGKPETLPAEAAQTAAAAAPSKPMPPKQAAAETAEVAQPTAASAPQAAELAAGAPVQTTAGPAEQAKREAAAQPPPPAPAAAAAVAPPKEPAARRPQRPDKEAQQAQQAAAAAAVQRMQQERRAANVAYGAECLLDRRVETLTVWQTNAAGVLVRNERLSGFVPTSLLSPVLVSQVLAQEQQLAAAAAAGMIVAQLETEGAPGSAAQGADLDAATRSTVRRAALAAVMMGRQVSARVVNVDEKSQRVVLSERAAASSWKDRGGRAAPPSLQELRAAAAQLGEIVDATVAVIKPFGCFVEFSVDLPAQPGGGPEQQQQQQQAGSATLVGLVHSSEVSWNPDVDAMQAVEVGQRVRAKIMHVDAAKARVFLSLRRTAPNPLLETLDSLVTSSAAATTAAGRDGGADGSSGGSAAGGSGGSTPALDQRPLLGDLPEAVRFCQLLRTAPGVLSAQLGVRLQSRAASQSLEVYIAKDAAAGIGTAVAAAEATPNSAATAAAAAGSSVGDGVPPASSNSSSSSSSSSSTSSYNLVLRKEQSVQEVALVAGLGREEVRQLAADTVAALAAEVEAAEVAIAAA